MNWFFEMYDVLNMFCLDDDMKGVDMYILQRLLFFGMKLMDVSLYLIDMSVVCINVVVEVMINWLGVLCVFEVEKLKLRYVRLFCYFKVIQEVLRVYCKFELMKGL